MAPTDPTQAQRAGRTQLRTLVVLQLACVSFVGAVCRQEPDSWFRVVERRWRVFVQALFILGFHSGWIVIPVLVFFAARRSDLPEWKCWMLVGIEAALVFAVFLAALPAVQ